jgi:hypothetical protein
MLIAAMVKRSETTFTAGLGRALLSAKEERLALA